jgi:putative inorganic carbon (HCO3(-)) transporter
MGLALVVAYITLNLLSPGDIFPSLTPYRPMLVLALVSVPPLLFARLSAPEIGKLRTQLILVLLFFGYACVSWLPHGGFGANVTTLSSLSPNVMAYFMGIVFLRTPFRLQIMRTTLMLIAVFVMANAFSEMFYVRATGDSAAYVLASHGLDNSIEARIRGLGMLNDPNQFGQYLLMVLPMLFVAKRETGLGTGYLLAIPIAVLFMVGVYFTGSRGTELGVAVLLGLFLTRRFKTSGAVAAGVLGALLLLAVNAINATSTRTITMSGGLDRLAIWSYGVSYFKQSPLFGIGIRGFLDRQGMTAHNSFLLCAAELGMLGYFLWMSMVVVTVIQLSRVPKAVEKSNPALARWAMALRLSLGVYMFTSFFISRTYDLPLFLLLGMSGGVIIAAGGDEAVPLRGTKWAAWSLGLCVSILALIYVMLRLRVV